MTTGRAGASPIELRVWQAARELISLHGGAAPLYVRQSVELSLERGDLKGAAEWRLVWNAIETMLGTSLGSCHPPR